MEAVKELLPGEPGPALAQVSGPRFLLQKQILRELLGTVLFPNMDAGRGLWLHTGWGPGNQAGAVEGTSLQAVVGSETMGQPGGTLPAEWLHLISLVRQKESLGTSKVVG